MSYKTYAPLKGILLSLAGFSFWAMGDAILKFLSTDYHIATLIFYNALIAVACFLLAAPKLGGLSPTFRSRKMKWHVLRGGLILIQMFLIVYAFSHMSLAKTYALIFAAPFFATILAIPLLKEHVTVKQILSVALGFIGILIILRPGMIPLSIPVIAAITAALVFSLSNLIVRHIDDGNEPLLAWPLIPEIIILLGSACLFLFHPEIPDTQHLPHIVFLGITSAAGLLCVSLAFVYAPAALAAPFHYVQMLWAIALGYIIFGDTLDLWTGAGAAIIVASGIWLIFLGRDQNKGSYNPPAPESVITGSEES